MAKRADSPYASGGRTADWLKIRTAKRQEVVIAGFTAPRRTRPFFGALVLAVRENDAWRYIGHVGTGFSHQTLETLHAKLSKLKAARSPFPAKVKDEGVTTWVRPSLVAEVKFAEWTSKGELRQPVYLGLRADMSSANGNGHANSVPSASGRGTEPILTLDQPMTRSDAKGQGGKPRTFRTGPNDRRWAAQAPSRESAA